MEVFRIFTDAEGHSQLETRRMPMSGIERPMSADLPITRMFCRETPAGNVEDFHTAPRRQFLVIYSGLLEVEISDGRRMTFRPGDMLFADDTTGEGHLTRSIRDTRGFIHLVVPAEFDIAEWPLGTPPQFVAAPAR